ncbi:Uncharacterized protein TPAR_08442 [Tolypocladium paradoxum]|uniref:Uncharacterized protein n=1 Tax=Tolypocladium paradoxum TaxID=94208 RepID=A0A2S4KMD4_9HYPO|nr:Uncharacterized protein TPAR_08442 [Tolypocladium paradoxum]
MAKAPFRNAISYEQRQFELLAIYLNNGTLNPHKTNAFNGPPREELEDQWDHLMKHESVRVQTGDLGQFEGDDSIIELADGSGHYSTVAVFHGLHCVQRLHHYLYLDHYYHELADEETFLLKQHTGSHEKSPTDSSGHGPLIGLSEHCLDWLRQYVQCNADTTLIPVHWSAEYDPPGLRCRRSSAHNIPALQVLWPQTLANTSAWSGITSTTGWQSVPLAPSSRVCSSIRYSVSG